ncbi:MAG: hypothetical protein MUE42_09085 [Opitutaceae bacterium]|jgi:hypothetical protein|nr:hypothetical protein [Opitutaceae bacterium]
MPQPTTSRPASVPVSFDCPADLAARLTALANAQGVPLSSFVAGLVVTPLHDQLAETSAHA